MTQQQPGSGDCGVFMLMFMMYLMFKLQLIIESCVDQTSIHIFKIVIMSVLIPCVNELIVAW